MLFYTCTHKLSNFVIYILKLDEGAYIYAGWLKGFAPLKQVTGFNSNMTSRCEAFVNFGFCLDS